MFLNPHDALPLPPRPNLEHYKKRAKDLVKACHSSNPAAIRNWAAAWIDSLVRLVRPRHHSPTPSPHRPLDRSARKIRSRKLIRDLHSCHRPIHHRPRPWIRELAPVREPSHRHRPRQFPDQPLRTSSRRHRHRRPRHTRRIASAKFGLDSHPFHAPPSRHAAALHLRQRCRGLPPENSGATSCR